MKIKIYTDGACSGNPGAGGWGAVVCLSEGTQRYSGYDPNTTNNRMELTAIVSVLRIVLDKIYQEEVCKKQIDLEIVSDSSYCVNAVNQKWLYFWKNNGYINSKGEEVKNKDLWEQLDDILQECEYVGFNLIFTKVKGHAGNPLNELADKLATGEIKKHIGG